MLKRIWLKIKNIVYQLKMFFMLPLHLHNHIIEMNKIENSIRFIMSDTSNFNQEVSRIKRSLESQNNLLIGISEKLDKIYNKLK